MTAVPVEGLIPANVYLKLRAAGCGRIFYLCASLFGNFLLIVILKIEIRDSENMFMALNTTITIQQDHIHNVWFVAIWSKAPGRGF